MEEFFSSIINYFRNRASSPLFGAFFFAWAIWNFRFFIIIFSEADLKLKLDLLNSEVFRHYSNFLMQRGMYDFWAKIIAIAVNSLLAPSFLTYLYLYQYPKLSNFVYGTYLKSQEQLKETKRKALGARVITEDEKQKLLADMEKARIREEKLKEKHNELITALTNDNQRLETQNQTLQKQLTDQKDPIKNLGSENVDSFSKAKKFLQKTSGTKKSLSGFQQTVNTSMPPTRDNDASLDYFLQALAAAFDDAEKIGRDQIIKFLKDETELTGIAVIDKLNRLEKEGVILMSGNNIILTAKGAKTFVENGLA